MVRKFAIGTVLLAALAAPACGSGGSPDASAAPAEPATITLTAYDFGYKVGTDVIPAGPVQTVLVNEGDQPHQALFYRLNEGVEFEDFKRKVSADDSLLPQLAEGGVDGLSQVAGPGEEISSTGDNLEPGNYAVVCFILDQSLKTSKNHAELGMISSFTVR